MTALEKLEQAIADDQANRRWFTMFTFKYGGYEFDYMGRYYAYVYEGSYLNTGSEDEYGWTSYAEMLGGMIAQTGKTVREMLAELPAHDLEIEFEVPMPPNATRVDEP